MVVVVSDRGRANSWRNALANFTLCGRRQQHFFGGEILDVTHTAEFFLSSSASRSKNFEI